MTTSNNILLSEFSAKCSAVAQELVALKFAVVVFVGSSLGSAGSSAEGWLSSL